MLLQFADGNLFASGAMAYTYEPATSNENSPRIILSILIGELQISAFVDTGGVYFLCSPEVAFELGLQPEASIGTLRMLFRGVFYYGHLHRIPLTFRAEEGHPLTVEVTAFVPQLLPGIEWSAEFPCILGMNGCLERLRFAIDPLTDTFYFGDLTGS